MSSCSLRAALALALLSTGAPRPSPAAAVAAWVQMTQQGAELRLVTDAPTCPPAAVDGAPRPMTERAAPDEGFANRVCVVALRPGERAIAEGVTRAAPVPRPMRLVIIGDTGCRLKGGTYQGCRDPAVWPFARIAALAAARRPDLVIHLGDYYYREKACPRWARGCVGSPYGDHWATWRAELFDPAAPLLAAAPWVLARGNHETCGRGGGGWFRMIDAGAPTSTCLARSATFPVDIGGPVLWIVDGSDADDVLASPKPVADWADAVRPALDNGAHGWIITHRPVWNAARLGNLVADGLVNATERKALEGRDLSAVDLILSGHVHNFSSLSFGGKRPPQLVDGAGGDLLDMEDSPPPTSGSATIDGLRADIFTMGRFGYFVFDRRGADWVGRFYDVADKPVAACVLHRRNLACRATPGSGAGVRADPRPHPAG